MKKKKQSIKKARRQKGSVILEATLFLIMLALVAGTAYYVWHSKNQANSAYDKIGNQSVEAVNTPTSRAQIEAAPAVKTTFLKLPSDLRDTVIAEYQKETPSCIAGGKLVDSDGRAYNPTVFYAPAGSAIVPIGCDAGLMGLFAVDKNDGWVFVESTQTDFSCEGIATNPVPKKLLQIGMSDTNCVISDSPTGETRSYDQNETVYFY